MWNRREMRSHCLDTIVASISDVLRLKKDHPHESVASSSRCRTRRARTYGEGTADRFGASRRCVGAIDRSPASFHAQQMPVPGGTQYVRVGGQGPAVVLLHGFGDTGDMWEPLAAILVKDHQVIVPDLRGMGLSSHPEGGYEKAAQARDLAAVLDTLKVQRFQLVTHDIGNMVGYALAAQYPEPRDELGGDGCATARSGQLGRAVDQPEGLAFQLPRARRGAPGGGPRAHPSGPLLQRAVRQSRRHRRGDTRALRGPVREAWRDPQRARRPVRGVRARCRGQQGAVREGGKLTMPILAIGGDHSYGPAMKTELETVAEHVEGAVIDRTPATGSWKSNHSRRSRSSPPGWKKVKAGMKNLRGRMTPVVAILMAVSPLVFPQDASLQKRVTPAEAESLVKATAGVGTSGTARGDHHGAIRRSGESRVVQHRMKVAPKTIIKAHAHRDTRTATVVSGVWYFGYGPRNEPSALKLLGAGSFYTEPAGQAHFARTTTEGAVVIITGYGPSDQRRTQKK